MFEQLDMAPADPILGLSAAFKTDPNLDKINLGVGVYQDANGQTPIFAAVKTAGPSAESFARSCPTSDHGSRSRPSARSAAR